MSVEETVTRLDRLNGHSFKELIEAEYQAIDFLNNVLPGGCTLLYGTIKKGKSALMEWLACVLGIELTINYFALEYGARMLSKRLAPLQEYNPTKIRFWHRYDLLDSGRSPLDFYREMNEINRPDIVFLDTLATVKPHTSGDYQREYDAAMAVRKVTDDLGASVVMAHHARKTNANDIGDPREMVLGSQGIGAAVDNLVLYERPDGATKLTGSGRLIDDFEIFLSFDSGKFEVEDASKVSLDILKRQAPSEYKALFALDDGPKTFSEIWMRVNEGAAPEFQISKPQVGNVLKSLAEKGLVKRPDRQGGVYTSQLEGKL